MRGPDRPLDDPAGPDRFRCYGGAMVTGWVSAQTASAEPAHVVSGAALLAIALGEEARGIRGLDVLRRSVDRAPPARS